MTEPLKINNPAIPKGSWIVITGVNGFIASHIADQLLASGWKVRGTVRSKSRTQWTNDLFEKAYGKGVFETVEVPDISKEGAFAEAFKGAAGVIHTATIVSLDGNPNNVIPKTIACTIEALKAANNEPGIKRFVMTSSSTAATFAIPDLEYTLTTESWNQNAVDAAWAPPPYEGLERAFFVYAASKTQGEQEMWKWAKENGRSDLIVNAVLPNANFGKAISTEVQSSLTWNWPRHVFNGEPEKVLVPTQYFVDVQDNARVHIAALLLPDVQSERIFAFAQIYDTNEILGILRKLYPGKKFVDDVKGLGRDVSKVPKDRAEELLRKVGRDGWTSLEQSVKWNTEDLA